MSPKPTDKRINYVEFETTDIKKVKDFYGSVFGWTFTDWGDDYCGFVDGDLDGGFRKTGSVTSGGPLIIFYSLSLERMVEDVKKAGGKLVQDIFAFPGGRRFHFEDPVGNVLAVWSDVDEKGKRIE